MSVCSCCRGWLVTGLLLQLLLQVMPLLCYRWCCCCCCCCFCFASSRLAAATAAAAAAAAAAVAVMFAATLSPGSKSRLPLPAAWSLLTNILCHHRQLVYHAMPASLTAT